MAKAKAPLMVTNCSVCGLSHGVMTKKLKKEKVIDSKKYTHSYRCGRRAVYSRGA